MATISKQGDRAANATANYDLQKDVQNLGKKVDTLDNQTISNVYEVIIQNYDNYNSLLKAATDDNLLKNKKVQQAKSFLMTTELKDQEWEQLGDFINIELENKGKFNFIIKKDGAFCNLVSLKKMIEEEERKNKVIEEYLVAIKELREDLENLIKSKTLEPKLQKTKEIIEGNIDNLENAVKNSLYLKNGEYISGLSKKNFDKAITFIRHGKVEVATGKLNKDKTPKVKSKKQAEFEINYVDKDNEQQSLKLIHKTTQDIKFKSGKTKARILFCSLDDLEKGLSKKLGYLIKYEWHNFPRTNATLITLASVAVVAIVIGLGSWHYSKEQSANTAKDNDLNAANEENQTAEADYKQNITKAQNDVKYKINSLVEASKNWNTKANGVEALERLEIYKNALEEFDKEGIVADVSKLPKSAEEILGASEGEELKQETIEEYMENLFANIDPSNSDMNSHINQKEIAKEYSEVLLADLDLIEESVKEDLVKSYNEAQLTKIDFSSVLPGSFKVEKVEIDFGEETDNIKIYSVRRSINSATGRVQAENCLETYTAENIKEYFDDDNEITDKELQEIVSKIDLKSLKTYTDYSYLKDFYDVTRVYISDADIATAMVANKENCEINVQVVKNDGAVFLKTYSYNNNGKDKTNTEIIESILSAVKTNYDSPMKTNVTVNGINLNNYDSPYDLFAAMDEEK